VCVLRAGTLPHVLKECELSLRDVCIHCRGEGTVSYGWTDTSASHSAVTKHKILVYSSRSILQVYSTLSTCSADVLC
jgi:hypothetical protein